MAEKVEKNHTFSKKVKAAWRKFLSFFKREDTKGPKELKTHSKFFALVAVQYRDKVDTSWTKSIKTIIQKIVFILIKFILIFVAVVVLLRVFAYMFMISKQIMDFFLIFLGVYVIMNLISVTMGLVKSLYYADDNKVLATYPITSSKLFLTKLIVFELFELKKSFDILLPISLGFLFVGVQKNLLPGFILVWSILPLFLIITVTVLLGALLSIPFSFLYSFLKKHPLVEVISLLVIAGLVIFGIVTVINLIPENKGGIDLHVSFGVIKAGIENFSAMFAKFVYPVNFAYRAIVGESVTNIMLNQFKWLTVARVGIMLVVAAALFGLAFLIIKPFYFVMMTKTFEFEKEMVDKDKGNKVRNKHWAFVLKEIKLTLRDMDVSGSYLAMYVAVPIMLLFIDKIFAAMSTNTRGDFMVAAFNVLLIVLPLLTSSTIVATIYSREGRTAYLKKTKPIRPYFPLTSKLLFNLVFVIPSIAVSSYIFARFTNQDVTCAVLLGFTVLGLQYGHIFFSASLDIMNPQNEVYATEGSSISNPNERKSTVLAFILSILFALVGFLLFRESYQKNGNLNGAFIKLMLAAFVFMASMIVLFYLKIKAFYIDRQEASRE